MLMEDLSHVGLKPSQLMRELLYAIGEENLHVHYESLRIIVDKSDEIFTIASTLDEAFARTYHIGHNNATSPAHSEALGIFWFAFVRALDVIELAGECMTRMIEAEETTIRSRHRHNRSLGNINHPPEHQTTKMNVTINDAWVKTRTNVGERANTGPLGRSRETDRVVVEGIT
ncbi:unnamed protein product [Clavelina lepadiformis]|uniref:Uncharacterized protein n=1 Tax=Clavelina lepadiformis TaxID=159417 RepID=A0ABP0EZX9_CLALP